MKKANQNFYSNLCKYFYIEYNYHFEPAAAAAAKSAEAVAFSAAAFAASAAATASSAAATAASAAAMASFAAAAAISAISSGDASSTGVTPGPVIACPRIFP